MLREALLPRSPLAVTLIAPQGFTRMSRNSATNVPFGLARTSLVWAAAPIRVVTRTCSPPAKPRPMTVRAGRSESVNLGTERAPAVGIETSAAVRTSRTSLAVLTGGV